MRWAILLFLICLAVFAQVRVSAPPRSLEATSDCPLGSAVETDGHRRLALVVGINTYAAANVTALRGAVGDAQRVAAILTDSNGMAFPRQNVCVLLNAGATRAGFMEAFQHGISARARSGDNVLIYFAGYGSETFDRDGDESDGVDETLLFEDARGPGEHDLVDDELNKLLSDVPRDASISLILDTCTAASSLPSPGGDSAFRCLQPDARTESYAHLQDTKPDGAVWRSPDLANVTVFAATNGPPALERSGSGVFTDALLRVISDTPDRSLTFAQLNAQIGHLIASASVQTPYIEGDRDREVFGAVIRRRPLSLTIGNVQNTQVELFGPPLPGVGAGAELRIYAPTASFQDMLDPKQMKALLSVSRAGPKPLAKIISQTADASPIAPGDVAVLARPAAQAANLQVRFTGPDDARPQFQRLLAQTQQELARVPEASVITLSEAAGDLSVFIDSDGRAIITSADGSPTNVIAPAPDQAWAIAMRLVGFARQRALLSLRGENGSALRDGNSVALVATPFAQSAGCGSSQWRNAAQGEPQVIPLCQTWQLHARLSESLKEPLNVTVLALTSDGAIHLLTDPHGMRLRPGGDALLNVRLTGQPPVGQYDYFVAFATPESAQNDFSSIEWDPAASGRSRGAASGALARTLSRFSSGGARGASVQTSGDDSAWAMSVLTTRVEVNPNFGGNSTDREYGVPDFDIRPYLPLDKTSALYRVLTVANSLAYATRNDGYNYRQHDWSRPTDSENLKLGIDCSRAIWFAFTRAGVPYTPGNRYISTVEMARPQSPLASQFDSCLMSSSQIGDVLVYRDDTRGDGHVVMVIDPQRRIAWGSHGWDGNPTPDRGIEYQRIKNHPDWARWDRPTMHVTACWRSRAFTHEFIRPSTRPGMMLDADVGCATQCRRPLSPRATR